MKTTAFRAKWAKQGCGERGCDGEGEAAVADGVSRHILLPVGQGARYLNQLYPAIDGMIEDIEGLHTGAGDPVKVRDLVVSAVRTDMALHLGKAVVAALAKEGLSSWLRDDLARAYSPEALSIVADDADHLPGFISRRLKNSPEFRGAMAA